MSRVEHESLNSQYTFVYGVDHVTSVFFQVFDSENELIVQANNRGVDKCEEFDKKCNFATSCIQELERAFDRARSKGIHFPNIDVDRLFNIAHRFGVELDKSEVYSTLD